MNLTKPYKYLYYKIYSLNHKTRGESDGPEFNALLGVSFLNFLNIYTLIIFIDYLTGFSLIEYLEIGKLKLVLGTALIIALNSVFFLTNDRYHQIYRQFKEETDKQSKWRWGLCLTYIILSFIALITLAKVAPVGKVTFLM